MLEELLNTFRQLTVEDIPFLIFMTAVFFGTLTLVFRMFGIEHPLLIPIVLILDLFCEINTWFEKRRKKRESGKNVIQIPRRHHHGNKRKNYPLYRDVSTQI